MKLSVLNSTSRQGRVSSLTSTKEAQEDFHNQITLALLPREAAVRFSWQESSSPCRPLAQTSKAYTVKQGGK
ncbi:MAG: hypothetical protein M3O33_14030 [Cyanobacteriota bacterium]|nr:hypothetical protein [Cyanobacteriota bacterium]